MRKISQDRDRLDQLSSLVLAVVRFLTELLRFIG